MKTIQELAREAGIEWDLIDEDEGQLWYITKAGLERFAALVEAPLRSDIEELLQENKLLRARNDRLEAQSQRKPLTNKEIMAIGKELGLKCRLGGNPNIDFDYARAIEAKLKAKNE